MTIRPIEERDYPLMEDFLYDAIFIPQGVEPPERDIVKRLELQVYVKDFGHRAGDAGLVAMEEGRVVAVAWGRIADDYGHIDSLTPSLAISVKREYRGMGIGKALLSSLSDHYRREGYAFLSLSVQKENRAVRLYLREGFEIFQDKGGEWIMVKNLQRFPISSK